MSVCTFPDCACEIPVESTRDGALLGIELCPTWRASAANQREPYCHYPFCKCTLFRSDGYKCPKGGERQPL